MKNIGNIVIRLFLICIIAIGLAGCASASSQKETILVKETGTLRTTTDGQIEGLRIAEDSVLAWYGVPYAQPPVGDLRWRAPVDPLPWQGVKEAKNFSPMAIQNSFGSSEPVGSEDCLYLNVYRPNTEEQNLPIMVFVHGGGNQSGSSQSLIGDTLAVHANAIIVSIDYRVGVLGFVQLPELKTGNPLEDSGNFGVLDIAQALRWVQRNAEVFGGNPNNITLAGQSAGGRDVLVALISPIFDGLFHKAIAVSGGMTVSTPESGEAVAYQQLAKILVAREMVSSVEDGLTWLKGASTQEVRDIMYGLTHSEIASFYDDAGIRLAPFPQLYTDGVVIPKEGFEALSNGAYHKVPVMLTSCESEFSLFGVMSPPLQMAFFRGTLDTVSDVALASKYYGSKLYASFNTDRIAEILVEQPEQPEIYVSRFAWGEDADISGDFYATYIGATHGADMDFINGSFTTPIQRMLPEPLYTDANKEGREKLSLQMQKSIGNFLHYGDPNGEDLPLWGAWTNRVEVPKLLVWDANETESTSYMSSEYIMAEDIWQAIEAKVAPDVADTLLNNLLAGRFFDNR